MTALPIVNLVISPLSRLYFWRWTFCRVAS